MVLSGNQMGVIQPRLVGGAISEPGMRKLVLKYEEYKERTLEGSALSVKVLIKEKLVKLICDKDSSGVPRSDGSEAHLIKAF